MSHYEERHLSSHSCPQSDLDEISYSLRVQVLLEQNRTVSYNDTISQLYTDVVWHRCELLPSKCTGDIRYSDLPGAEITHQTGPFMIIGHLL